MSRVLSTHTNWQRELEAVFNVLHTNCQLLLTTGCSMHVHVSPFEDQFTAEHLRGICKGLCYFDDAITRVMPADRKENEWAVSNVVGRGAGVSQKLRRSYSLVPAQTWARLFKLLDKVTPGTVHGLLASDSRYLSWNFEHITQDCGTVEFRRPPGVDSARKASHWAAFALGFVAQAMDSETDWARLEALKTVGSVEELRTFVTQGLERLGTTCSGALNVVREDPSPPDVLTQEELDQIEWKKQRKGKTGSPFAEKVSTPCFFMSLLLLAVVAICCRRRDMPPLSCTWSCYWRGWLTFWCRQIRGPTLRLARKLTLRRSSWQKLPSFKAKVSLRRYGFQAGLCFLCVGWVANMGIQRERVDLWN